jgi:hypothetical protein
MNESLRQKQERFTLQLAILVLALAGRGYRARLREVWRTPEQAKLNAAKGLGISNSLHLDALAADVYLSRDGQSLPETRQAYADMGELWKSMGSDHRWGGDFRKANRPAPDIYHVSIMHDGRK